jgi:hypothetical protein
MILSTGEHIFIRKNGVIINREELYLLDARTMGASFIWLAASVSWSSVHSIARNCSSVQVIEHVNAAKNDEQPAHKSSMEKKMHFQN